MSTKAFKGEFKGKQIFEIHVVDEEDTPKYDRPLISFGVNKAKAILDHIEEIKEFVDENDHE